MSHVAPCPSHPHLTSKKTALALVIALAAPALPARAASDDARTSSTDALALALARLRGEIEDVSDDIEAMEAEARERRTTLAALATEASAERSRAEARRARLVEEQARKRAATLALSSSEAALVPSVRRVLAALDAHITSGLPFKVDERRAAVRELDDGLAAGTLPPRQALLRTWSLVQDEDRMTKENVLDRQVIALDGDALHADVVRLGMTALYFKTSDERVGLFVRTHDGFAPRVLDDKEDAALVRALFEAQKNQVKSGRFTLPVDVAASAASSTGAKR